MSNETFIFPLIEYMAAADDWLERYARFWAACRVLREAEPNFFEALNEFLKNYQSSSKEETLRAIGDTNA